MVNTQLNLGSFPQAGMAYIHLAMISISRFNMVKFASDIGNIALALLSRWSDPYTTGRGGTIYSLFVGHLQESLQSSLKQLDGALEYVIQVGDRGSTILNFGLVGMLKFFASENLTELESFLNYGCEEVPNWTFDTRGGTMASKSSAKSSPYHVVWVLYVCPPNSRLQKHTCHGTMDLLTLLCQLPFDKHVEPYKARQI